MTDYMYYFLKIVNKNPINPQFVYCLFQLTSQFFEEENLTFLKTGLIYKIWPISKSYIFKYVIVAMKTKVGIP